MLAQVLRKEYNMINLVERTDHIFVYGKDYEYYTFYLKNKTEFTVNESEFYALDKLYDGELACKVEN